MSIILTNTNRYTSNVSAEFPHKSFLRPACGVCCFSLSVTTEEYAWVGCMHNTHLCCTLFKGACFKYSRISSNFMVCYSNEGELVEIEPLCAIHNQFLCLDSRFSLPLSFTVPQLVTCCFLTVWHNQHFVFKCCAEVREL